MAKFEAVRWAEGLIGAAGESSPEAVSALGEISAALEAVGRPIRGAVEAARLEEALGRAFGKASLGADCAQRVAILLARRGRLYGIAAVAAAAKTLLDERAGILRISAESAVPLTAEEREGLRVALSRVLAARRDGTKTIELDERVDPGLLGGIRIGIGSERIDGTLSRRLEAMASAMGAVRRGGDTW